MTIPENKPKKTWLKWVVALALLVALFLALDPCNALSGSPPSTPE